MISADGKAAICARRESPRLAGEKGAGWVHSLDTTTTAPVMTQQPPMDTRQHIKAPQEILDRTYRALLDALSLFPDHRDDLLHRGLSPGDIVNLGYKSLPECNRDKIVRRVRASNCITAGVPGFYYDAGWQLTGQSGILVPVRDLLKRIIGMQIRVNKVVSGGKYRWLSSSKYYDGCSSGAPVHVAGSNPGDIWVTEGILKADIMALQLGEMVLAVPGVSTWMGSISILRLLAPTRVITAFDMDKNSTDVKKRFVRLHLDNFTTYLVSHGIRTFEADWDDKYKGLDDYLTEDEDV